MTEQSDSGDSVDISVDETASAFAAGDTLAGKVIAQKYELVKLLGKGGMGAVYEAKNQSTLRRCAVKLLVSSELAQHPGIVKRFFREAKASAVAESDHIVQVFDSGTDPSSGAPYLVMELLRGESVEDLIDRIDVLEPHAAAKLVMQAATGLSRAHELGIVHRDIKPANLFLTDRDGGDVLIKVFDFGIAKVKMESFVDTSHGLTRTGILIGTPLYMSPEQARGASSVDARTDVWSLGIVLYRLLTGRLPYDNVSSLGDLMVAIITAEIPSVQSVAPWVSSELSRVVARSLARDVEQRFASGSELRSALEATLGDDRRLRKSDLRGVSDEQRSIAPPNVEPPMDEGVVRAATKSGAGTTSPSVPAKKSRAIVAAVAAGGIVVVTMILVVLGMKGSATSAKPSAEAVPTPPSALATKAFRLAVPAEAKAWIDDVEATVESGSIEVRGNPGETRRVRVSRDGREQTQVVAITDRQLVPSQIELPGADVAITQPSAEPDVKKPATAPDKKAPTTAATKPATTKPPETKKPDTKKPDTKKPPDFATSQDEFNQ